MEPETLPLVILGGADRTPADLPEEGRNKHPLAGYKGAALRVGGKLLVQVLADRFRHTGRVSTVFVVGPERIYRPLGLDLEIVDSDGTYGENLKAAVDAVARVHPGSAVAFTTCDILPDTATLRALLDHWAAHAPCDAWFPLIRVPTDRRLLGQSAWKPSYRVVPEPGAPAVEVLPGHVVVADPPALRLGLLYRLLQIAYQTRNRPIEHRRAVMMRKVVLVLLYRDLMNLLRFRLPNLTVSVIRAGLGIARNLRSGAITQEQLEDALRRMFVKYAHRRRHPDRRVVLPILEGLSTAKDIDTEEEAAELGAEVARGEGSPEFVAPPEGAA
jgi:hypothetical protein